MNSTNFSYKELTSALGYKFIITVKKYNPIHWIIALFLWITRINTTYLTNYYTVILSFLSVPTAEDRKRIKKDNMEPKDVGLIAHESTHRLQHKRDGLLKHWFGYLFQPKKRAQIEAEAYATSMLVNLLLRGEYAAKLYIVNIASILHNGYAIKNRKTLTDAEQYLAHHFKEFKKGNYRDIDEKLINFLQSHGYGV